MSDSEENSLYAKDVNQDGDLVVDSSKSSDNRREDTYLFMLSR